MLRSSIRAGARVVGTAASLAIIWTVAPWLIAVGLIVGVCTDEEPSR